MRSLNHRDTMNYFGERLKACRKAKGLSLDQLAKLTKSSKSYLWELENKTERKPSVKKLSIIALELDTTMEYLIGWVHETDAEFMIFHVKFLKLSKEDRKRLIRIVEDWQPRK